MRVLLEFMKPAYPEVFIIKIAPVLHGVIKKKYKHSKTGQNAFLVFFGHFWAYVGQPHGHIGWAIPMPFASMNSTNPRTAPWNFHKKILRIGGFEKWPFFESAILNSIFSKKFFFSLIPTEISPHLYDSKDFSKFWWLRWFTAKTQCPQTYQPAVYVRT